MSERTADKKYVRARSMADAIAALQQSEGSGVLVAGGLVIGSLINQGLLASETIIDISRVDGLRRIEIAPDGSLSIGALVTHDDILTSALVAKAAPLLVEIAKDIACGRLRNRGTIGGSLCMIGQQGDPATGLIALQATLKIRGPRGARSVALEDFYRDAFAIDLEPDELVERVSVPPAESAQRWGFAKLGPRHAMDWTQLATSVVLTLGKPEGTVEHIRVGMNGAAPAAVRARRAEAALIGRRFSAIAWPEVAAALNCDIAPEGDVVFSADYKRHLASVLLRRAVAKAIPGDADKAGVQ